MIEDNLDAFVEEERVDADFDAFDNKDKEKDIIRIKKEDWDSSIDDEQEPLLEDEEDLDEDGNPRELDFDHE